MAEDSDTMMDPNMGKQVEEKTSTLLAEMLTQLKGIQDALSGTPQQIQQLEVKVDNQHTEVIKEATKSWYA